MEKIYCFTLDDNIRFMENACRRKEPSLLQSPYLAMLFRQHKEFGCKFQLNMFYSYYPGSFSLADVPDTYKKELKENSGWLKFSFHARHNDPPYPYEDDVALLERDFEDVMSQLNRIAGPDAVARTTTIHYAAASPEGCSMLGNHGIRGLIGMFYEKTGREALHYHLSPDEAEKLRRGEFVYDAQTGLTFAHNDIILNQHGLGETEAIIENIIQNVERRQHTPFIQLMTHEQYFYEDYAAWQPDFEEKLHSALRILHQNGYRPVFLEDVIGGKTEGGNTEKQ